MNVKFNELTDLITDQDDLIKMEGEIVAPDSATEL
jgi:hypothetical protein